MSETSGREDRTSAGRSAQEWADTAATLAEALEWIADAPRTGNPLEWPTEAHARAVAALRAYREAGKPA